MLCRVSLSTRFSAASLLAYSLERWRSRRFSTRLTRASRLCLVATHRTNRCSGKTIAQKAADGFCVRPVNTQILIAERHQGRGILGVVEGSRRLA